MYKNKLQELCQKKSWTLPVYDTARDGPPHSPLFTTTVTVNSVPFTSLTPSRTSKLSQNDAAMLAFNHFSEQNPISAPFLPNLSSFPQPSFAAPLNALPLQGDIINFRSQVNYCKQKENSSNDDDDDNIASDENAEVKDHTKEVHVAKNKITGFMGDLLSTPLAIVRKTKTQNQMFPSTISRCLLGSFRKVRRIVCFGKRQQYSIWKRY